MHHACVLCMWHTSKIHTAYMPREADTAADFAHACAVQIYCMCMQYGASPQPVSQVVLGTCGRCRQHSLRLVPFVNSTLLVNASMPSALCQCTPSFEIHMRVADRPSLWLSICHPHFVWKMSGSSPAIRDSLVTVRITLVIEVITATFV